MTIRTLALLALIVSSTIASCSASSSLTEEERAYLAQVREVELPLKLSPDRAEEAITRAIAWVNTYSVYQIETQGPTHVETKMPRSRLEGGHGYRVDLRELDGGLAIDILAFQADMWESGETVPDPFVARMLGLYILEGIEPPNKRVGFEEVRR